MKATLDWLMKKPEVLFGIVILLWLLNFSFIYLGDNKGVYGDMFGAVNALFSGLAFAGIFISLRIQQQEIENQNTEIRAQKDAYEKQNELIRVQQFETSFFNLLTNFNKVREETLPHLSSFFNEFVPYVIVNNIPYQSFKTQSNITPLYNFPNPYIKTLSVLISFVIVRETQKAPMYFQILKSYLKTNELVLLYYRIQYDQYKYLDVIKESGFIDEKEMEKEMDELKKQVENKTVVF